jgi:hypothetical protein
MIYPVTAAGQRTGKIFLSSAGGRASSDKVVDLICR